MSNGVEMSSTDQFGTPPPFFPDRWVPWSELWDAQGDLEDSLGRLGVYLVGRFREPPTSPPTGIEGDGAPSADGVVYVGETHGRTRSLLLRLTQFTTSAGIYQTAADGHYAAWDYRKRCAPSEAPTGPLSDAEKARMYVALCPNPAEVEADKQRPDARGVLPGLTESLLLWRFVQARGGLPVLNNSGSHGGNATRESAVAVAGGVSEKEILVLLDSTKNAQRKYKAARRILDDVVVAGWGYSSRKVYHDNGGESGVHYALRFLGGRRYAYVGWTDDGAFLSLWDGDECVFGRDDCPTGSDARPVNGAKPDVAGFRKLVEDAHMVQCG